MDYSIELNGHTLEYVDDGHIYLVDGVIVPSITQMLSVRFGRKYAHVDKDTLRRAADKGTQVHEAIEQLIRTGEAADLPEVRDFQFLKRVYGFEVKDCEVPVILFKDDDPVAAGRLDLVLEMDGQIGGADIKRTSTLDKEYLAYQLNLYRIAYAQCYGVEWEFLRAIHLRDGARKFVQIPINNDLIWEFVGEVLGDKE